MSRISKVTSLVATVFLIAFLVSPSEAAYTVSPKYKQCFNHTKSDVFAPSPLKNPVSCSKIHTAEIYYVSTWPSSTPPWAYSDSDALDLAASICESSTALNNFTDSFNYWEIGRAHV